MGKIWDLAISEVMECLAQRTVYLEVKIISSFSNKIIWKGIFSVELQVLEINF